jgi:DNA-binding NarL/FixJ family response regulator
LEILTLAARGKSNQEIAQEVNITPRTVKAYLTDIFSKLNVGSRTEAVITALKLGIINFNDIGFCNDQ